MFLPFSWMLKGYGTVCLPHVCPEHEVKKPTRMGEYVFFHSFPLHLKFKAMKFFTVRAQGFPGKCLAETTDMFQVEKLRFVHVCTVFFPPTNQYTPTINIGVWRFRDFLERNMYLFIYRTCSIFDCSRP